MKAILEPSGDHAGSKSCAGLVVRRRRPVPSALIVQMSSVLLEKVILPGRVATLIGAAAWEAGGGGDGWLCCPAVAAQVLEVVDYPAGGLVRWSACLADPRAGASAAPPLQRGCRRCPSGAYRAHLPTCWSCSVRASLPRRLGPSPRRWPGSWPSLGYVR